MRISLTKNLQPIKEEALSFVDKSAETFRLNFITDGAGQAMTYKQKRDEADAYLQDNLVDQEKIPHLVSESIRRSTTIMEVAQEIVVISNRWQRISAMIEFKRLNAKKIIKNATNEFQIESAKNVNWQEVLNEIAVN